MNVKSFLFSLSFLLITPIINTAELTIYNQLSKQVPIKVVWLSWQNKDVSKNYMIAPNSYIHVSTGGAYPFRRLLWIDSTPTFVGGYAIDIPSSKMMLNGQIYIGANGEYMINFNQNGVSKWTVPLPALPVKPSYVE